MLAKIRICCEKNKKSLEKLFMGHMYKKYEIFTKNSGLCFEKWLIAQKNVIAQIN